MLAVFDGEGIHYAAVQVQKVQDAAAGGAELPEGKIAGHAVVADGLNEVGGVAVLRGRPKRTVPATQTSF